MVCKNYWAGYGYYRVWEDETYFYSIDRPGGVTNKILKSAVCANQENIIGGTPQPQGALQDNTWMKWVLVGIVFIAVMFILGGKR